MGDHACPPVHETTFSARERRAGRNPCKYHLTAVPIWPIYCLLLKTSNGIGKQEVLHETNNRLKVGGHTWVSHRLASGRERRGKTTHPINCKGCQGPKIADRADYETCPLSATSRSRRSFGRSAGGRRDSRNKQVCTDSVRAGAWSYRLNPTGTT